MFAMFFVQISCFGSVPETNWNGYRKIPLEEPFCLNALIETSQVEGGRIGRLTIPYICRNSFSGLLLRDHDFISGL